MQGEASAGIVLMGATVIALALANGPLSQDWFHLLHVKLGPLSLLHWINDGLMAIFFLLVGLEIKRELLDGQLSTAERRILPGVAALAGMAAPAIIFFFINRNAPENVRGWAIPAATDIAFALGVLALLGRMVPGALRPFLTAVAVLDDLGAVVIIALFYTADIAGNALFAGLGLALLLVLLNRFRVQSLWPYLLIGAALWVAVLMSGVHATIAGVILAFAIPLRITPGEPDAMQSPLYRLEHAIAPWVGFGIVPLFGLANAGIDLRGLDPSILLAPLTFGIVMGLFLGKQLGIFLACSAVIKAKLASRPSHASWMQLYGVAVLCGIGFTMSLFIGGLAFGEGSARDDQVKLGVLAGSLLSAMFGALILALAFRYKKSRTA